MHLHRHSEEDDRERGGAELMRAVVLAGGKGTRLRPYTTVLPKPLVPVGERPILELIIHQLARCGFRRIDLSVGHLGELIRAYFREAPALPEGVELHYHWEDQPLGTAGALRNIDLPPDESLLVMNGDVLTTLDFGELMRFHSDHGATLTIGTHRKDVELALGVVEGESDGVTGYVEKPTLSYVVSMGIYAYHPRALQYIPEGGLDFPDLVLALIQAGEKVVHYHHTGAWYDIGTTQEHERAVAAYQESPELFDP
jgi:NDP-mannose synthase